MKIWYVYWHDYFLHMQFSLWVTNFKPSEYKNQPNGPKKTFFLNPKIEIQKFGSEDFEIQQFAFKPQNKSFKILIWYIMLSNASIEHGQT
jgi:hypothetical protein